MAWKTEDGRVFDNEAEAQNHANGLGGGITDVAAQGLMLLLIPLLIAVGLLAALIWFKRNILYFVAMFIMAALWFAFNKFILKRIDDKLPPFVLKFPKALSGAAAIIVTLFVLFPMVGGHYKRALDPVGIERDTIIAQKDGSQAGLFRKPSSFKSQGKPIVSLAPGAVVELEGATRDRQDFRVKTAEGKRGYIARPALAASAMPAPFSSLQKALGNSQTMATRPGKARFMEMTAELIEQQGGQLNIPSDETRGKAATLIGIGYGNAYTVLSIKPADEKDTAFLFYGYLEDLDTGKITGVEDAAGPNSAGEYSVVFAPSFKSKHFLFGVGKNPLNPAEIELERQVTFPDVRVP